MRTLSHSALKLYLYLALNSNGFEFWLSKTHLMSVTGLSRSTYFRVFNELESKGYIRKKENKYIFRDIT